jgi:hypothetical protein
MVPEVLQGRDPALARREDGRHVDVRVWAAPETTPDALTTSTFSCDTAYPRSSASRSATARAWSMLR